MNDRMSPRGCVPRYGKMTEYKNPSHDISVITKRPARAKCAQKLNGVIAWEAELVHD
jgi:hypothetical protein